MWISFLLVVMFFTSLAQWFLHIRRKLHVVIRLLYVLDTSDVHNTSILLVLMGAVTVISAHAGNKMKTEKYGLWSRSCRMLFCTMVVKGLISSSQSPLSISKYLKVLSTILLHTFLYVPLSTWFNIPLLIKQLLSVPIFRECS